MPFFKPTTALFDTQLEQLAGKAVAAAEVLVDMVEHPEKAEEKARIVDELEHGADRIVRDTTALRQSAIGAADRNDLMELLESVDDIIDVADAAAERLWLHQVGQPTPEARELAKLFLESARHVKTLISTLRHLRESHEVLDTCMAINDLEKKSDKAYRDAMLALFSGQYDALHIARWKDVYERFERGANKCEDVAKLVEGLVQAIA